MEKNLTKKDEKRIIKALEGLVQERHSKASLSERLGAIFGAKTKVEDISKKDDEIADFNFLAEMKNDAIGLFGYVDIYFLKMRREGHNGAKFLITEVAYQFE